MCRSRDFETLTKCRFMHGEGEEVRGGLGGGAPAAGSQQPSGHQLNRETRCGDTQLLEMIHLAVAVTENSAFVSSEAQNKILSSPPPPRLLLLTPTLPPLPRPPFVCRVVCVVVEPPLAAFKGRNHAHYPVC